MKKESQLSEGLRELAGDVTETAAYLRELGVEFLESAAVELPNARPADESQGERPAARRGDVRRPPVLQRKRRSGQTDNGITRRFERASSSSSVFEDICCRCFGRAIRAN